MAFSSKFSTTVVKSVPELLAPIAFACVLSFMPIGNPFAWAMQTGQPPAAGAAAAESGASEEEFKQKVAQRRQFYFDVLLQELDSMVPGEYEEGSKQKAELERAINAFLDSDIKTLNEILDQQAAFDPDFPPRHLLLASLSYRVRDAAQGRRLLEKSAVESPRYPGTYAAFARLALNEGRITDAGALLEKCARMVSESQVSDKVKTHFDKQYVAGMLKVAVAQKRFQDARALLDQQMILLPDNPKCYLTGAEIEFQAGNLEKSQAYLEKVKSMVPDARPFESVFARWFRDMGKTNEAEKWILAAAEQYPKDGASQMDYVNWRMGQGDLEAVRAALPQVESLTGETTAIRLLKGQLAFADEKMNEAESVLFKVIEETNGRNLEAVNLYALALAESSEPEKLKQAQKIAQQTLGRAPRSSIAKASLAYVLLKQGVTDQPQRLLLPVVRGERVSSEIAYFFGCLLNALGKQDAARQAFQSALEADELFLYRNKCQKLLDQLGGPIASDSDAPVDSLPAPLPTP
jgi:tetratricopeptide (TPR) repeat protein